MTVGGGIEEERKVCVVGVLGIWVFGEWWKEQMGSGLWFKQEEEHGSLGMWVVGDGQGKRRSGEEEVMGFGFWVNGVLIGRKKREWWFVRRRRGK